MKPRPILCFVLISFSVGGPLAAAKKKLIFLNFYNKTGTANTQYLETSIIDSIDQLIRDKYIYERIPNAEWQKLTKTENFKPEDYFDTSKLQHIGLALRADGIIFGKIDSHPQGIVITGKILSVIDKDVIAEKELVAPLTANMFESVNTISESLAAKIKDLFVPSDLGALRRSALLPGWGQFYKQRPQWGYIWSITVGTSFLVSSYFTYSYISNAAKYRNATTEDNPADYYAKAQSDYKTMGIFWYITGGLYVLNLFDAYFFQGNYDLEKREGQVSFLSENLHFDVKQSIANAGRPAPTSETVITVMWRHKL